MSAAHKEVSKPKTFAHIERNTLAALQSAQIALWQYVSDLKYPPQGDSIDRRIEAANKAAAECSAIIEAESAKLLVTDDLKYRGWQMNFDYPPTPHRGADWCATHPDYDGAPDGCTIALYAATQRELMVEIDCWFLDLEDET